MRIGPVIMLLLHLITHQVVVVSCTWCRCDEDFSPMSLTPIGQHEENFLMCMSEQFVHFQSKKNSFSPNWYD